MSQTIDSLLTYTLTVDNIPQRGPDFGGKTWGKYTNCKTQAQMEG